MQADVSATIISVVTVNHYCQAFTNKIAQHNTFNIILSSVTQIHETKCESTW